MCIHSVLQQQMTDEAVVTTETVTNYLHLAASGSSQIITASIPTFFYRLDALSADQTNCIKALNTNFSILLKLLSHHLCTTANTPEPVGTPECFLNIFVYCH